MSKSKYFPRNYSRSSCAIRCNGMLVNRAYTTNLDDTITFNQFGFLRSDFAVLNDMQDQISFEAAAKRLQELQSMEPDNSKLSFDQIVEQIRPRWCQHPDDIIKFQQFLISRNIDLLNGKLDEIEDEERKAAEQHSAQQIPLSPNLDINQSNLNTN